MCRLVGSSSGTATSSKPHATDRDRGCKMLEESGPAVDIRRRVDEALASLGDSGLDHHPLASRLSEHGDRVERWVIRRDGSADVKVSIESRRVVFEVARVAMWEIQAGAGGVDAGEVAAALRGVLSNWVVVKLTRFRRKATVSLFGADGLMLHRREGWGTGAHRRSEFVDRKVRLYEPLVPFAPVAAPSSGGVSEEDTAAFLEAKRRVDDALIAMGQPFGLDDHPLALVVHMYPGGHENWELARTDGPSVVVEIAPFHIEVLVGDGTSIGVEIVIPDYDFDDPVNGVEAVLRRVCTSPLTVETTNDGRLVTTTLKAASDVGQLVASHRTHFWIDGTDGLRSYEPLLGDGSAFSEDWVHPRVEFDEARLVDDVRCRVDRALGMLGELHGLMDHPLATRVQIWPSGQETWLVTRPGSSDAFLTLGADSFAVGLDLSDTDWWHVDREQFDDPGHGILDLLRFALKSRVMVEEVGRRTSLTIFPLHDTPPSEGTWYPARHVVADGSRWIHRLYEPVLVPGISDTYGDGD